MAATIMVIVQADPLGPNGISVPSGTPIKNFVPESKTLQVIFTAIIMFKGFWFDVSNSVVAIMKVYNDFKIAF